MFSRILLFVAVACFAPYLAEAAPVSSARQFLPPMPGFIPVYIRAGDTPLEEINLDLAEAFKSYAIKQARMNSLRARSQNALTNEEDSKNPDKIESNFDLIRPTRTPQHIQKIKPKA